MEFGASSEKQYHCDHEFIYTYESWEDYPELTALILSAAAAVWATKDGFCSKCKEVTTEHTNNPSLVQVYTALSQQQKKEKKLKEMWSYL